MKGYLLDAYGVFWGGNDFGMIPGAMETMAELVARGKIVGILSNSTQLSGKEIQKLKKAGLIQGKHYHFLMTSGDMIRHILLNCALPFETPQKTYWVFGKDHPKFSSYKEIFQDTVYVEVPVIDQADFIYLSIPHINGEDQTDKELFRHDLEGLKTKKTPVICANPDQFAHEGSPPKAVIRQGTIAMMYEQMGGKVFYIGKPHRHMYVQAMQNFEKFKINNVNDILMVGDTPETDIRGARLLGIPSALVTGTGMMAERISLHGLEMALKSLPENDQPNYLVRELSQILDLA